MESFLTGFEAEAQKLKEQKLQEHWNNKRFGDDEKRKYKEYFDKADNGTGLIDSKAQI